mgnify:CR=1 FL=1
MFEEGFFLDIEELEYFLLEVIFNSQNPTPRNDHLLTFLPFLNVNLFNDDLVEVAYDHYSEI